MRKVLSLLSLGVVVSMSAPSRAAECDAAAANPQWVFCHDFEVADADDFNKYWNDVYGVPDRTFILADNPAGVAGSKCMRLVAENTTSQALTSGITSGPKKFLGQTVSWDSLYYRRYVRFNTGFKQGNFMHLGGMGACAASLYPWDCMGGAGIRPSGDDRFSSNLEPWSDYQSLPWPGRWGFYSYYHEMYMDCGNPGPDDCYGDMFSPAQDVFTSLGQWHVLEMMIKPNTPNVADGYQTFWIDGEQKFTASGINWRTTADLRINKIGNYLYIHNVPANTTDILDVDNVIISTQYIGPAPCEAAAVIAAPCLCGGTANPQDASNVFSTGYCCAGSWQATACGGPSPDSGVPAPDSSVPAPDSSVPAPDSSVPAPDSNVPAPDSNVPAPDSSELTDTLVPDTTAPADGATSDLALSDAAGADAVKKGGQAEGGCGCTVARPTGVLWWVVLLVLFRRRVRA